jgi:hypothetical protein
MKFAKATTSKYLHKAIYPLTWRYHHILVMQPTSISLSFTSKTSKPLPNFEITLQIGLFFPEKGVDLGLFPYLLPKPLVVALDHLKLKVVVTHQPSYIESMVRQFYSSILTNVQDATVVRGMPIPFSSKSINYHFVLSKNPLEDMKCDFQKLCRK